MAMESFHDPSTIQQILAYTRTIAVVGLSSKPDRPSHQVAEYLRERGYRVFAVNPNEREVFGEPAFARLSDVPTPIDVVDVFRRSAYVPPVVDEAIAVGARALWLQIGVVDEDAAGRARSAGLDVVMDRCLKVEHARYRGPAHRLGADPTVGNPGQGAAE